MQRTNIELLWQMNTPVIYDNDSGMFELDVILFMLIAESDTWIVRVHDREYA